MLSDESRNNQFKVQKVQNIYVRSAVSDNPISPSPPPATRDLRLGPCLEGLLVESHLTGKKMATGLCE